MELWQVIFVVILAYIVTKVARAFLILRRTRQKLVELNDVAQRLDRYRMINFEQVEGTWLVYDSVRGDFLQQAQTLAEIIDAMRRRWPDKIVLGLNKTDQDVYLISCPEGVKVGTDEGLPLVDK